MAKLREIEALAKEVDQALSEAPDSAFDGDHCWPLKGEEVQEGFIHYVQFRGFAMSRIEKDVIVGSGEFQDARGHGIASWPDGYSSHYLDRFNVEPTPAFREYVEHFNLDAFRRTAARIKTCLAAATTASPSSMEI